MKKIGFYRLLLKFRGVFFFLFLLILPLTSIYLLRYILLSTGNEILIKISNDKFLIIPIHYIFFILFLFIIFKYSKKSINFFSRENWFLSMEKAVRPATKAFALGFFSTMMIVYLFEFIPGLDFIKDWLKTPNYGFVYFLENIDKENQIKVILLFFYIIVLVPINEEILFRGFLQDSFQKIFKKYNLDVIITSFIFSLFHIVSLSNTIFAFVIGIFLSKIRKKEDSINTTIWIHAFVNFTGLLSGLLFLYLNKLFK